MTILLLDDERSFADSRDALVARTVDEAISYAETLEVINELWLDFILMPGDTIPFVRYLVTRAREGNLLPVNRIIFHSSAFEAHGLVEYWVKLIPGYPEVELPEVPVTKTIIGLTK